jgi:hypothetical protein
MHKGFWWGKSKERHHFEILAIDGIYNGSKNRDAGFIWLRIRTFQTK